MFGASWQLAERARKEADASRARLLHHEHDHGCQTGDVNPQAVAGPFQESEELILGDQGQSGG